MTQGTLTFWHLVGFVVQSVCSPLTFFPYSNFATCRTQNRKWSSTASPSKFDGAIPASHRVDIDARIRKPFMNNVFSFVKDVFLFREIHTAFLFSYVRGLLIVWLNILSKWMFCTTSRLWEKSSICEELKFALCFTVNASFGLACFQCRCRRGYQKP